MTQKQYITAIRVWNYKKNWESSFRGARHVKIEIDGKTLHGTTLVLRKSVGPPSLDEYQDILVAAPSLLSFDHAVCDSCSALQPIVRHSYEISHYPKGLTLKIVLLSTCGDPHYIGLNG